MAVRLLIDEYGRLLLGGVLVNAPPVVAGAAGNPARRGPVVPPMTATNDDARSPGWAKFLRRLFAERADKAKKFAPCLGCGRAAETGHHEVPFGVNRDLELVPTNVLLVCVLCHFGLCHLGNWRTFNPKARKALAYHLAMMKAAKPI